MKNKIIKINDFSDIDTSKISVYDLNNRYLDNDGNLFGLKFNNLTKKINIIKLIRTHNNDVAKVKKEILSKKIKNSEKFHEYSEDIALENSSFNDSLYDNTEPEEDIIDGNKLITDSLKKMKQHKERLLGIIKNIKNSNLFPKENKDESANLENLYRDIEIEGVQSFEKVENYEKELLSYPRSITYYHAKMDREGRETIDSLAGNKHRIQKFIHYYEMSNVIIEYNVRLIDYLKKLKNFIKSKKEDDNQHITEIERQYFRDAKLSLNNTIEEIEILLLDIKPLKEFSLDIKNI